MKCCCVLCRILRSAAGSLTQVSLATSQAHRLAIVSFSFFVRISIFKGRFFFSGFETPPQYRTFAKFFIREIYFPTWVKLDSCARVLGYAANKQRERDISTDLFWYLVRSD